MTTQYAIIKNWLNAKILSYYNTKQQKESKIYKWNVYLHGYIAQFVWAPLVLLYVSVCLSVQINKVSQRHHTSVMSLDSKHNIQCAGVFT